MNAIPAYKVKAFVNQDGLVTIVPPNVEFDSPGLIELQDIFEVDVLFRVHDVVRARFGVFPNLICGLEGCLPSYNISGEKAIASIKRIEFEDGSLWTKEKKQVRYFIDDSAIKCYIAEEVVENEQSVHTDDRAWDPDYTEFVWDQKIYTSWNEVLDVYPESQFQLFPLNQ